MNGVRWGCALAAATVVATLAHAGEYQSESPHVAPDPPQRVMGDMSNQAMIELMEMDDRGAVGMLLFDQLEWREIGDAGASFSDALFWDAEGWYGGDYDKVWVKSAGGRIDGDVEARHEVLWDHVFARWWNLRTGVRHDLGDGPSRTWAAIGVQGLAPYWFDVQATAYVGERGRTAFRLSAEYELLLTQRCVLRPELSVNLYGKDDEANGIGSGLSDAELGLRFGYEIRRELAPYVGVTWKWLYGDTADLARDEDHGSKDMHWVAGVRWWF